jgi:hypothetical protein
MAMNPGKNDDVKPHAAVTRDADEPLRQEGMAIEDALAILCEEHTGPGVRIGHTPDFAKLDAERYREAWRTVRRQLGLPVEF